LKAERSLEHSAIKKHEGAARNEDEKQKKIRKTKGGGSLGPGVVPLGGRKKKTRLNVKGHS